MRIRHWYVPVSYTHLDVYKRQRESEYVLSDGVPVLESSIEPSVKGVSVICEGGDDIKVIARITEFVSVGLGIPTNRICVTKMN